jgi:type 1 glutamine amidotransferase
MRVHPGESILKPSRSTLAAAGIVLAVLSAPASGQSIRVILFNSCGSFVHTIGLQTPLIRAMLNDPAHAGIGNPQVPIDPILVDSIGALQGTLEDGHQLIQALPTHDVVVLVSNSEMGRILTEADRKAFLAWARAKGHGVVALHGAAMDAGTWPEKSEYFGADYSGWTMGPGRILPDTTPGTYDNQDVRALNMGLEGNHDLNDEWMSFRTAPRATPGIHVLTTLDERIAKLDFPMGDHPVSWYRIADEGGRFFYTASGHDWKTLRDDYWVRRQLYNAILWTAGGSDRVLVSVAVPVTGRGQDGMAFGADGAAEARLTLTVDREGPHRIEIRDVRGALLSWALGSGRESHAFTLVNRNALVAVRVSGPDWSQARLIKMP